MNKAGHMICLIAVLTSIISQALANVPQRTIVLEAAAITTPSHNPLDSERKSIPLELPIQSGMGEESEEDDDDNPKEKEIRKCSSSSLAQFLQLLYIRQTLIFERTSIDVSTPPPKS
jgi:hypothetical protein